MITIKHRYTNEVILEIESLCNADLSNADLRNADLSGADLSYANLRHADLSETNLRYADLSEANLSNADLINADLINADLSEANLSDAELCWCIGNMHEIKSAQFDTYEVTWSKDALAIGYQQHPIKEWWQFDDATIIKMDGDMLLWWKKWKLVLQQIVEMSA